MNISKLLSSGILAATLVSGVALAQTGSLSVGWSTAAPIVYITGPGVTAEGVYATPFEVTGGSWLPTPVSGPGTPPPGFNQNDFYSFCTDIGVNMQASHQYSAVSFSGQSGVNPNWRQVGGSYLPAIQMAQYLLLHNYSTAFGANAHTVNAGQAAGLQLAIWNVLYDGDYSVSGGTFSATGDATALADANSFLSQLAGVDPSAWNTLLSTWLAPVGGGSQGMLYPPSSSPKDGSVPDGSSTLMLVGMALGAAGFLGRKLRK